MMRRLNVPSTTFDSSPFLVAYPSDLRRYSSRLKAAVLLADFYYVTGHFAADETFCREILAGQFHQLQPLQTDYLHYLYGCCLYRDGWKAGDFSGHARALSQWQKILQAHHGTLTECRASVAFYNLSQTSGTQKLRREGLVVLQQLATSGLHNRYVYIARIEWGLALIKHGRRPEGVAILQGVSKASGPFYGIAQYDLKMALKQSANGN